MQFDSGQICYLSIFFFFFFSFIFFLLSKMILLETMFPLALSRERVLGQHNKLKHDVFPQHKIPRLALKAKIDYDGSIDGWTWNEIGFVAWRIRLK